jgi:hypothetical protein
VLRKQQQILAAQTKLTTVCYKTTALLLLSQLGSCRQANSLVPSQSIALAWRDWRALKKLRKKHTSHCAKLAATATTSASNGLRTEE